MADSIRSAITFARSAPPPAFPEQVVKEWLGHADSKMVRHYYHLHDDETQRQMDRVTFFGSAGGAVAAGNISGRAEGPATGPKVTESNLEGKKL